MMRLAHTLPASAALLLVAAAPAAADRRVNVRDFEFTPRTVQIQPAESVAFNFKGPSTHTATLLSGQTDRFDSGQVAAGSTKAHRFNYPGNFALHCTLHPQMTARVKVGAAETVPPRISRLRARPGAGRVKLVFRISERSVVTAVVGRKRVRKVLDRGARSITVRGLASGRRTARIGAKDGWGNRSPTAKKSFQVP